MVERSANEIRTRRRRLVFVALLVFHLLLAAALVFAYIMLLRSQETDDASIDPIPDAIPEPVVPAPDFEPVAPESVSEGGSESVPEPAPEKITETAPSPAPNQAKKTADTTPAPTAAPTRLKTSSPTTPQPTASPVVATPQPTHIGYVPGDLSVRQGGWRLSTGLSVRLLAQAGRKVKYNDGSTSSIAFHYFPDMGATFPDPREENPGGWIYVSNSEVRRPFNLGGVGSMTFDSEGRLMDYRMVLEGTTSNCGGGRTKWNSWISCEEYGNGVCWEVDPTGERPAREITPSKDEPAFYESFAYDDRHNHYFLTEDNEAGPLRRFEPYEPNPSDPWDTLHGEGEVTYLRLYPESDSFGYYEWDSNKKKAAKNAQAFYPNSEGIDVDGNQLFFISKKLHTMFVIDLDDETYTSHTTRSGVFDGQPDQLKRLIGENTDSNLLYFTEDGEDNAGIHARDETGDFFTIVEAPRSCNETTGLSFNPSGHFMYVADQINGKLYEFSRDDGLPFHAKSLNIQYHAKNN